MKIIIEIENDEQKDHILTYLADADMNGEFGFAFDVKIDDVEVE